MILQRIGLALALLLASAPGVLAAETTVESSDADRATGFRPFYVQWTNPEGVRDEFTIFYPLFFYRNYGDSYEWSVFDLINRFRPAQKGPPSTEAQPHSLDIWPLYFSRETGDPATTYHALLPIAGEIQNFVTFYDIKFVLFPLYVQTGKRGATTEWTPFPFIRSTRGAETGFAIWPLFGWNDRPGPGGWERRYCLWPLIWNNTERAPDTSPPGTADTREVGFLPFYAATRGPDLDSVNYLWPFIGYADRRAPYRYQETRYFWPFFVQGRGDDHYHNRWGPFYTHSVVKGVDKTWIAWPLFRQAKWDEGDVFQTKTQFFFWVYWKLEQRKISNPAAAPAYKEHFWPFVSIWDNGAGQRQWQVLSPFEVLFPHNREMRESWTPLFAFYRHSESPAGSRTSLFWNAVSWQSQPDGRRTWRLFALKFSRSPANVAETASR